MREATSREDEGAANAERAFLPWRGASPLAARMRPRGLEDFVGQDHILAEGSPLRLAVESDRLSSMILWGPPGCGKTSLARVMASRARCEFETLSAVLAGVKDIREVVARARSRLEPGLLAAPRRTILFVDEVHRFSTTQQDALLPHVENGTVIFIGATTENPYFGITRALVSRTRVFELRPLSEEDIRRVLVGALEDPRHGYGGRSVHVSEEALRHFARMAHGDARSALSALEFAVETSGPARAREGSADAGAPIEIDLAAAEAASERSAIQHDKDGDCHYDTISAFIKSLRGSDPDASLFWLARLTAAGEDPRFLARRMVIFASEDVGMADPLALLVAVSAAHAVEFVGMPECQYALAQACIHLATAPKSNSAGGYFEARRRIEAGADDEVPSALRDPSRDGKALGHGKGYLYPHDFPGHWVAQRYLPRGLEGVRFYEPGSLGYEKRVADRLEARRASGSTSAGGDDG